MVFDQTSISSSFLLDNARRLSTPLPRRGLSPLVSASFDVGTG